MQNKKLHVLMGFFCFVFGLKVRKMYHKLMAFSREVIFQSLIRMLSRPKARNQFLFLVLKSKQDCNCCAKNLALTFDGT